MYLALDVMTAIKEANQGLAHKIEPCVLCSYDVDCEDIADLRGDAARAEYGIDTADLACAWFAILSAGKEPPSWRIARRLTADGLAGILVPSFAPGATEQDHNLVLWRWQDRRPHRVSLFDPNRRVASLREPA